jgi:cytochrome c oxidase assembly protein subunit 15
VRLHRVAVLRPWARWLAALLGLQLATGLSNVVLDWPLLAAVLHTGGAAGLVVVLTAVICQTRSALDTVSASRFSASRLGPL